MECHCGRHGSFKVVANNGAVTLEKLKKKVKEESGERHCNRQLQQLKFVRQRRKKKQTSMANAMTNWYSWLFLAICATLLLLSSAPTAEAGALGMEITWTPSMEEEFQFESEISRRILATSKYISYGALQRNTVPCSRRGASYYNCQPGAQANPYSRGCSAITRCRS